MSGADRRETIEPDVFVRDFLLARRPIVLTGALRGWSAPGRWSPAFLRDRFGDREVNLAWNEGTVVLGDYVDAVEADPGGVPYLRNVFLNECLPELRGDVDPPAFARPDWFREGLLRDAIPDHWKDWVELFLSGTGVRYPLVHVDTLMTHAWIGQVHGVKRLWVWPPIPLQKVLVRSGLVHDAGPPGKVDADTDLERLFDHAAPTAVDLHPGEVAFLPAGWWHTTETLETSLSVSGNFVNASNWRDLRDLAYAMADVGRLATIGEVFDALATSR